MAYRGMDIQGLHDKNMKKRGPHPSTYTDMRIDESPMAYEDRQPWYMPLERGREKAMSWLGGKYDDTKDYLQEAIDYDSDTVDTDESFGDPYAFEANSMKNRLDFKGLSAKVASHTDLGPDKLEGPGERVDESDYSYLDEKFGPDSQDISELSIMDDNVGKQFDDADADSFGDPYEYEGTPESGPEASWWDGLGDKSDGKPLTPMQKYAGKMIMDQFSSKPESPMATIGASPMTSGKQFDMSYLKKRPKKERYRNQGLLARA